MRSRPRVGRPIASLAHRTSRARVWLCLVPLTRSVPQSRATWFQLRQHRCHRLLRPLPSGRRGRSHIATDQARTAGPAAGAVMTAGAPRRRLRYRWMTARRPSATARYMSASRTTATAQISTAGLAATDTAAGAPLIIRCRRRPPRSPARDVGGPARSPVAAIAGSR